jgi:1-acyl-sn-glycerol-3-phosphate acyltransferase
MRRMVKEPRYSILLHKMYERWMGFYMPAIFCPVRHKGYENFKEGENYVVVINHNSLIDIPVSAPGLPGPTRTLAKDSFAKLPLFGPIYKAGSILINRKSNKSRQESIAKMIEVLQEGKHLALYPEGTRNKTKEPLARFHDGAFRVAIEAQKDIIPGIILGTRSILHPTKKFWAWPNKLDFHFLEPITTAGMTLADVAALKDKTKAIMLAYLEEHIEKLECKF